MMPCASSRAFFVVASVFASAGSLRHKLRGAMWIAEGPGLQKNAVLNSDEVISYCDEIWPEVEKRIEFFLSVIEKELPQLHKDPTKEEDMSRLAKKQKVLQLADDLMTELDTNLQQCQDRKQIVEQIKQFQGTIKMVQCDVKWPDMLEKLEVSWSNAKGRITQLHKDPELAKDSLQQVNDLMTKLDAHLELCNSTNHPAIISQINEYRGIFKMVQIACGSNSSNIMTEGLKRALSTHEGPGPHDNATSSSHEDMSHCNEKGLDKIEAAGSDIQLFTGFLHKGPDVKQSISRRAHDLVVMLYALLELCINEQNKRNAIIGTISMVQGALKMVQDMTG